MATVKADLAKPNAPCPSNSIAPANTVLSMYSTYVIAAALSAADIIQMGKLPKGAVPIGGYLAVTDIDTGTEALEIDVGIAANGVDSADPDFFTNSGVITGDAGAGSGITTNAAEVRTFYGPFPVPMLHDETIVTATIVAAANAGGTGTVVVRVDYITPGEPTS